MDNADLLLTDFCESLTGLLPEKQPCSLAIAVSGGSDSIALVHFAQHFAKTDGHTLIALTVDHNLRKESRAEAEQVHEWLTALGIEHHTLTWEHDTIPESDIQSAARTARYDLMTEWCKQHHISYLLTAHHHNDQAETVLIRLLRGSSVDGLAAMPKLTYYNDIAILRPLLPVPHREIKNYLKQKNISWIEDPSNQDSRYTRVQVRKFLENPDILTDDTALFIKRLADTATHMGRVRNYLETQTNDAIPSCVTSHDTGYCALNRNKFRQLHDEIGLRVLTSVLNHISSNTTKPRFSKLLYLYNNICSDSHFSGQTFWGCALKAGKDDTIEISREHAALTPSVMIKPSTSLLWDNRFMCTLHSHDKLLYPLTIKPLGDIDYKSTCQELPSLPHYIMHTFPALIHLENLLAAPHINYYKEPWLKECFSITLEPSIPLLTRTFCYN